MSFDDFGAVVDWFTENLGAPAENTTNDFKEQNATWQISQDGYTTTVDVFDMPGEDTRIDVTKTKD
ncbi:MAG: hypothetical protein KKF41_09935 [Actinobacteria bacterium]|nr:hypothetical protein [Actinomycetota bacterium]MBU1943162.1 hypothetical protein [Actinomycetota bacterium]MBU2687892.1 hypothetical protein [Actinomycetota bacterium]